jgi:hypothetical protein
MRGNTQNTPFIRTYKKIGISVRGLFVVGRAVLGVPLRPTLVQRAASAWNPIVTHCDPSLHVAIRFIKPFPKYDFVFVGKTVG